MSKYKTTKIDQFKKDLSEKGFLSALASVTRVLSDNFRFLTIKFFGKKDTFVYKGQEYPYFLHRYNKTFRNERAVELSLAQNVLNTYQSKRILEIGNVLTHYFEPHHDIVDKFELGENVINEDIVDFTPQQKYDLIISISTLEHVGFDEADKDPEKLEKVFELLPDWITKDGEIFITVPFGYNATLDKLLESRLLNPSWMKITIMKRTSRSNKWEEMTINNPAEIREFTYNTPFSNGNFLAVISNK